MQFLRSRAMPSSSDSMVGVGHLADGRDDVGTGQHARGAFNGPDSAPSAGIRLGALHVDHAQTGDFSVFRYQGILSAKEVEFHAFTPGFLYLLVIGGSVRLGGGGRSDVPCRLRCALRPGQQSMATLRRPQTTTSPSSAGGTPASTPS